MGLFNDLLKAASQVKSFAEDIQAAAGEYKTQENASSAEHKPQEGTATVDNISLLMPAGCDKRILL